MFILLFVTIETQQYCYFESNLSVALLIKVFLTKKACNVVLKSSKHQSITFPRVCFVFILYFIGIAFHWQFFVPYILSISLKFGACYITGHWDNFNVKNASLCRYILSFVFLKKLVFLSFSFLILMRYQVFTTECQPIRNQNWW